MKKILIAIDNDFIREAYEEVFQKEKFKVFVTKDGKEALKTAEKEDPDVVLADVLLSKLDGFDLLKKLKNIPVILFAQIERTEIRKKAMELGARDFITAAGVSPVEVIRKVKIVLGEQKTYKVKVDKESLNIRELAEDLGYDPSLKCQKCGGDLSLYLMRDLSSGEKHFIVSFVCPNCNK